jgi:hypothetical protein
VQTWRSFDGQGAAADHGPFSVQAKVRFRFAVILKSMRVQRKKSCGVALLVAAGADFERNPTLV